MTNPRLVTALALALSLAPSTGCLIGDDEPDSASVQQLVTGVSTADGRARATFVAGPLPVPGAGPALTVETNGSVIPGGTTPTLLLADRPFTTIVIAVDSFGGYFLLTLPQPTTSTELIVGLSQELALGAFNWVYSVGTGGSYGGYHVEPASVVVVGTGDVQISLSWNSDADVDLHVVDPSGEEIYYGSRDSLSGGELDLDSNAGCGSDSVRNENITWPVGRAPAGTYRVLVDYWSSCGVAATDYTVTVNVKGQAPQTFNGAFTGEGDRGGSGDGVLITTFTSGSAAARIAPTHTNLGSLAVDHDPSAPVNLKSATP
jgi:hypothetical protein